MDREKRNAIREQSMKGESSDWVLHLPLSSEDERREVDGATGETDRPWSRSVTAAASCASFVGVR